VTEGWTFAILVAGCVAAIVAGVNRCDGNRAERQRGHDLCVYACAQDQKPLLSCHAQYAVCGTAREPVTATWGSR
jgi:hypothetical protein